MWVTGFKLHTTIVLKLVNESDVRIGFLIRVNKFLHKLSKVLDFGWHRALVTGFKLHTTIVLKL